MTNNAIVKRSPAAAAVRTPPSNAVVAAAGSPPSNAVVAATGSSEIPPLVTRYPTADEISGGLMYWMNSASFGQPMISFEEAVRKASIEKWQREEKRKREEEERQREKERLDEERREREWERVEAEARRRRDDFDAMLLSRLQKEGRDLRKVRGGDWHVVHSWCEDWHVVHPELESGATTPALAADNKSLSVAEFKAKRRAEIGHSEIKALR